MADTGEIIAAIIGTGGVTAVAPYLLKFVKEWWQQNADARVQESKLSIDQSKEQLALSQAGESFNLRAARKLLEKQREDSEQLAKERREAHERDIKGVIERAESNKQELLGIIGNQEKRIDACEKDRVWLRVILTRVIEANRHKDDYTREQEQDFFRPVEVWEKVQDDKRVEEAKKREEDDSVH